MTRAGMWAAGVEALQAAWTAGLGVRPASVVLVCPVLSERGRVLGWRAYEAPSLEADALRPLWAEGRTVAEAAAAGVAEVCREPVQRGGVWVAGAPLVGVFRLSEGGAAPVRVRGAELLGAAVAGLDQARRYGRLSVYEFEARAELARLALLPTGGRA